MVLAGGRGLLENPLNKIELIDLRFYKAKVTFKIICDRRSPPFSAAAFLVEFGDHINFFKKNYFKSNFSPLEA